jgi:hypothetical protein
MSGAAVARESRFESVAFDFGDQKATELLVGAKECFNFKIKQR